MKRLILPAALALFIIGSAYLSVGQVGKEKVEEDPGAAGEAAPGGAKEKGKAQEKAKGKAKAATVVVPSIELKGEVFSLRDEKRQRDFPVVATDEAGTLWIVYVEHDGEADTLWLGRKTESGLEAVEALSEEGVIHHPALAVDGSGTIWAFWGQTGPENVVHLMARSVKSGTAGEILTLAQSGGSDSFADAGTDGSGRVWVTWQSMRAGEGDIFARFHDPASSTWSEEIAVSNEPGGDWEPAITFAGEEAWIVYDSSRGNEFNLYLAKIDGRGSVETFPLAHTPRYEARADVTAAADGSGLWIAAERGRVRWGLDLRGHVITNGLNGHKEILFGKFDLTTETFTEMPLGPAGEAGNPVNLPALGVDASGNPWLSYRYFNVNRWQIALTRLDPEKGIWHSRRGLPGSSMGQDRRSSFVQDGSGGLWFSWPSDLRMDKTCGVAGVYLAELETGKPFQPASPPLAAKVPDDEPFAPSQSTPERPSGERHQWTHDGETYTLIWGDFHRHTDVSNCRTGQEGCIVEQFRYAYDMAKLDFLGTSDHTDIVKIYDPYEWWHNQRLHDVFHTPGKFTSMYVYEREQRWPWGHRNVVFARRGGPIVYIKRATYRSSPWQALYPAEANPTLTEIEPPELWRILKAYGGPVAIVSHTGATGMGTDWGRYDESTFDYSLENVVEIFQGARVSYEGIGTPQPTAGLRPGETYTADTGGEVPAPPAPIEDFGKFNAGVYQNALQMGLRLGVFASSDHISTHVSYGGVYVKEISREGIIEGLKERRTVAATDKIYLEFVCNNEVLGSIFETDGNPEFRISVNGTSPLRRVTIVRNEEDYRVWDAIGGQTLKETFADDKPVRGQESRYYLRVEQDDGNMAWSSPVWVTMAEE